MDDEKSLEANLNKDKRVILSTIISTSTSLFLNCRKLLTSPHKHLNNIKNNKISSALLLVSNVVISTVGAYLGSSFAKIDVLDTKLDRDVSDIICKEISELQKKSMNQELNSFEEARLKTLKNIRNQHVYAGKEMYGPRLYLYSFLSYKYDDDYWGVMKLPSLAGTSACFSSIYSKNTRSFAFGYITNYALKLLDKDIDNDKSFDGIVCLDRNTKPNFIMFSNFMNKKTTPIQISYKFGLTPNIPEANISKNSLK